MREGEAGVKSTIYKHASYTIETVLLTFKNLYFDNSYSFFETKWFISRQKFNSLKLLCWKVW